MSRIEIIQEGGRVSIDPVGSAFAHGYALFETLRIKGRRLFFWEAHWARLIDSARAHGFPTDFEEAEVLQAVRALAVDLPPERAGSLKLSLFEEGGGGRLLVYLRPASAWPERVRLQLVDDSRICPGHLLAGHKSHNYMENLLLLRRAKSEGFDEALRLTVAGHLAEATVSNFFFFREGRLFTPGLDCGILPGVMRSELLRIASERGIELREGRFALTDLEGSEAAIISNSSCGLRPVAEIRGPGFAWTASESGFGAVAELQEGLSVAEECKAFLL